jgi:hypothetical protein
VNGSGQQQSRHWSEINNLKSGGGPGRNEKRQNLWLQMQSQSERLCALERRGG